VTIYSFQSELILWCALYPMPICSNDWCKWNLVWMYVCKETKL